MLTLEYMYPDISTHIIMEMIIQVLYNGPVARNIKYFKLHVTSHLDPFQCMENIGESTDNLTTLVY